MTRRVLVISAHPDDETLGCGGTLLKHRAAGDTIGWIIATKGWVPLVSRKWLGVRDREVRWVANAYGVKSTMRLGFPASKLESSSIEDLIFAMRKAVHSFMPDIVYMVHRGDVHGDHRVVFDATWVALKPTGAGAGVGEIYAYETLSSTNLAPPLADRQFIPDTFSDISVYIDRKLEILQAYKSEIHPPPHPRSMDGVKALARVRGAAASMSYAEAFMTLRRFV